MKTESTPQESMGGKVVESRLTMILDWAYSLIRDFAHLMRELGAGIVVGYILGAAAYVACFVIAFKIPPSGEWWLNILLCFLGGAVGWFVGTLGSPMSGAEESKFAEYGKVLSALVTGFIAAKLDSLMGSFTTNHADLAVLIGRVLLFTVPFFLCLQFPFIARWRVRPGTVGKTPEHPVFKAADELAQRMGVSRSRLYSVALQRFVQEYDDDAITAKLNEVYSTDPILQSIQSRSVTKKD